MIAVFIPLWITPDVETECDEILLRVESNK